MKTLVRLLRPLALTGLFLLVAGSVFATGIKVVPSMDRVAPGESFFVDIVAENVPALGLGTVQFRLNVDADVSPVVGVTDINQSNDSAVNVVTPLLMSAPTATRSGLGDLFLDLYQGSNGILVMDNESLTGGSALYTYAHTNGANLPSGSGSVARFQFKVGSRVAAEKIQIDLTEVMLIGGGVEYPLDSNLGATITLRCSVAVSNLNGLSLAEAQTALTASELRVGNVYEINNPGNSQAHGVVLQQSVAAGDFAECESAIDLAINLAPEEVTGLSAIDLIGDDTGKVVLSWTPSSSSDTSGYRVYYGANKLIDVNDAQSGTATVGGLPIGSAAQLKVTSYDNFGNESGGVLVTATALDDVPPVIGFKNVSDGAYYAAPVQPQLDPNENHPDSLVAKLNATPYTWSQISADGIYTLEVTMVDTSGNSTTESITFTVDQSAPVINVPNVTDGSFLNARVTPEIVIDDLSVDTAQAIVTLNGQPYVLGAGIAGEGAQILVVSAIDKAGNQASLTVSFVLDLTAPAISIADVTDGSYYRSGVVPTVAIVDAHLSGSSITLNGSPFVSGTDVDAEGVYQLVATAADAAGNEVAQTINFTVDLSAPVINVTEVTDGAYYNTDVTPTIDFVDVSLADSSLTLNGAPYVSGTPVTAEGVYALAAAASDLAGNAAELSLNFTIDKTAPVIEVSGIADGAFVNVDVVPVVTVTDLHIASSTLQLNDAPFVSGTTVSAENGYILVAGAEDEAGNRTEVRLLFVIDKTAPVSSLDLGAPRYQGETTLYVAGATAVTLSPVDNGPAPSGVMGIAYSIDSATPWADYAGRFDFTTLTEGLHSLAYRATDVAGNVETDLTLAVTVDNSAPVSTLTVDGAQHDSGENLFVAGATTFNVSSTDNYSGVASTEYRIDASEWTVYAPFTSSGDGVHTIEYRSIDNLGHVESINSFNVTVDDTAPVTTISIGAPQYAANDTLYVTSATGFTLAAIDTTSGVELIEYRLDSGDWQTYAPFSLPVEGTHLIEYRSHDQVGNLENVQVLTVQVDNTPPETAITANQPQYTDENGLFVAGTTAFTVTSEDPQAGVALVEYRIDDGAWTEFELFSVPDEGKHVIAYRATDNLGNLADMQTLAITVDNTAPISAIEIGEPQYSVDGVLHITAAAEIRLSATDSLAGVASIEYRFDESDWQDYADAFTMEELIDGTHVIDYRAIDNVGNVELAQSLTVVVDNTSPVTTVNIDGAQFVAEDGTLFATGTTTFTLAAIDELVGVALTEYRIDAGEWTVYEPFTLSGEGERRIEFRSNDLLGNLEETHVLTLIVDDTPPTTEATTGTPQYTGDESLFVTGATSISLASDDNSAGASNTEYRIDTADWQDYAAAFTLAGLADGAHNVGYRSTDNLGNLEDEQVLSVVVDNTAPASSLIGGQPQHTAANGSLFVAGHTPFTINVVEQHAGIASTEYRVDASDWTVYEPFTVLTEGEHTVLYHSADHLGNAEADKSLTMTVDNTAPVTEIAVTDPQYVDGSDQLYVTSASIFTLKAKDNLSGVATTQYRIDSGAWLAYAPFVVAEDGPHRIEFRSTDNVGHVEEAKSLYVVVDYDAPVTSLTVGGPRYDDGALVYVTSESLFSLSAEDNWAGVAATEYRIDGGDWSPAAPFRLADEGEHRIEFRSVDLLGNREDTQVLTVIVDNTASATKIAFSHQNFADGDVLLMTRATKIVLTAEDELSGVAAVYYRYDDQTAWRTCQGPFHAAELSFGDHVVHFYSVDNLGNREQKQSVAFTLIGAEVNVTLLNLPRVLVWTEDPAEMQGANAPNYTLSEVHSLVAQAMGTADATVELVTDQDRFRQQFRSGIFNVVMVLNQNVPFNAPFLRELREAVAHGRIGLLVSSWGNNVHPILQSMFGLDFAGSLSMNEEQRALTLFDSSVSNQGSAATFGRILKTRLDGGKVAGIVPAESQCGGVRGISLVYPQTVDAGSLLTVSVFTQKGNKLTLVDEEQMVVTALPSDGVNDFAGNPAGDVIVDRVNEDGVNFTLTAPYGSLEAGYVVNVKIEGTDGSLVESGAVQVAPTCDANLMAGMNIGPFEVTAVDDDRIQKGEDLPAVVLNEYGQGRTVFLAYNLIDSALRDDSPVHGDVLGRSAHYLLPESDGVEPAGIGLVETTITFNGAGMDLLAVETLAEGLTHLPLFDLTHTPLEYRFRLDDGQEASYRYFVRFPDQRGGYPKETDLFLELDGAAVPYESYTHVFKVDTDSGSLLQQALLLTAEMEAQYPVSAQSLGEIASALQGIGAMPKSTAGDYGAVIAEVVQVLEDVKRLPHATDALQEVLGGYLRIMQALGAVLK